MTALPRNTILIGDASARLRELPTASVDCVITSPPYFQLRNYRTQGQIGLEPHVNGWVQALRPVLREVARVLKPTGALWLNLGDSFSRHPRYGAPPKGLLLAPERLLLALTADGWIVRNKVIWAKTNPLPSSVTDRLTLTYEVVYFLVRQPSYYFDLDAIREPHRSSAARRARPPLNLTPDWAGPLATTMGGLRRARAAGTPGHALGKNPGDVWQIATRGYRGAHFATFPEALVRRPLLTTCPQAVCTGCNQPARRKAQASAGALVPCGCGAPTRPGLVLDPFFGSGTVGLAAQKLGRDWLGIELNPAYVRLAEARLSLVAEAQDPLGAAA
jgi:site-specific DNA-methyltransferase (adenine-specific)